MESGFLMEIAGVVVNAKGREHDNKITNSLAASSWDDEREEGESPIPLATMMMKSIRIVGLAVAIC
jgi:hypothetical protein